jgi:hypothetical protein
MVKTKVKQTRVLGTELESGFDRIVGQDQDLVCNRIWDLGCFVLNPVGCRNRIHEIL